MTVVVRRLLELLGRNGSPAPHPPRWLYAAALALGLSIALAMSVVTGAGSVAGGLTAGVLCVAAMWTLQGARSTSGR